MERNVGGIDRTERLLIGVLLVMGALIAFAGYVTVGTVIAGIALLVGAILFVTGVTQRCPINQVVGINTIRR